LAAFFAFPAIQYFILKRFSRREGAPELWYLPNYGFRLVIRNLPGRHALSEIKQRAFLRTIVAPNRGASVTTLQDDLLVEREDFFVFPGTDQILLCFQLQGDVPDSLFFVLTDKLGVEKARFPLSSFQKVICDYTATLNNSLNFNVKLAKRAELKTESIIRMWREIRKNNVESDFKLDRIREVS